MMKNRIWNHSFLRFLLVGIGNTLLSLAIMFLLERLGYWPSTAIAYTAGAALSFFLNRYFTFHSEEKFGRSLGKFVVNVAVCYAIGYGLAKVLVPIPEQPGAVPIIWFERLSKLVGMVLYTGLNYLGQRFFAFHRGNDKAEQDTESRENT